VTADRAGNSPSIEREQSEMEMGMETVYRVSKGLIHSCSNMLQVCMSGLEMLAIECRGNPEALGLIDRIKESQLSLQRLLASFRDYAAPIQLEPRQNHLGELLQEAWARLTSCGQDHGARLLPRSTRQDLRCLVDRAAIERLFHSILQFIIQAAEASPPGRAPGACEIGVEWSADRTARQDSVVLDLTHPALQMPPPERAAVFEPFSRCRAGEVTPNLALARRIAAAHGGRITLEGSDAGEAAIRVILPREPLSGQPKVQAPSEARRGGGPGGACGEGAAG
jgi:signal transduction histidine kinase